MIKRKDFMDYEVVLALYTIAECDLPEMLRDDYRAVRSSICALTENIEQYRDAKTDTLLSACED